MKRRDFLKVSGVALAGSALVGCNELGAGKKGADLVSGKAGSNGTGQNGEEQNAPVAYRPGGKARMKLSFEPYELKMQHTFTVASNSRTTTPGVQLKIEYDGFTAHGEASMPPYLGQSVDSVCNFLKKVDLSRFSDPFQMEDILTYIDSLSPGDSAAKAAVDIALHDLVGQLLGQPWFRIWGLNPEKAPSTTFTIGIDTPEVVKQKTLECAGKYNILKVKVGRENDKEMIETIRTVTDLPIAVDANQGWKDRSKALDEIFWLKEHGVVMVEQPMAKERVEDNAWITERSPLPVYADEAIQRLADLPGIKGAYHGINIKLMKCTGMREAYRMASWARAEGMRVMLGCMVETSCAVTAAAHLSPLADFADLDGNLLITNDRFEGVTVQGGKLILPDRPGLGLVEIK